MKKIILLISLIYSLALSNTSNNDFTKIEQDYIKSNTVTFGLINDYYPFSFIENDIVYGFSYDYIELLRQKSGLKIEIDMDNWSSNLNKFKDKKIDLINGISYKESRTSFTQFTPSYFEIPNVIFSRKGEFNDYIGLSSLKGKKVGITKDIYYYDKVKDLKLFEIVEFENSKDKMQALAYGKVDAIFNNLISGQKYIKRGAYGNIKILEELDPSIIKKEDLRIGVTKDNDVLFSIINKSMEAITRQEKEMLYNKWFSAKFQGAANKPSIKLTKKEEDYLSEKKQITMCIDPDWMPFEKIEKGKHVGLSAEYIEIVKNNIKIPIKLIQTKNWDESVKKAKSRECDIYSMSSMTSNRQKYMDFTSPYLDIPIVIATQLDKVFIDNIDQILDKKIGIVKGYSIFNILKKRYPNIKLTTVDSINDGLRQVESGKIFAFIDNLATVNYEIQKRFQSSIKVSGRLDIILSYRIGTRNDQPILHDIFEKIITNIDMGTKEKIFNKWIHPPKVEKVVDFKILLYFLFAIIVFFVVSIYRQYVLKRINRNLKIAVNEKTKDLQKLNKNLALEIQVGIEKNLDIQEKLFKAEKLASMGEMIANIAHQWRQPLSVISTGITGMKLQKELDSLPDHIFYDTCTSINSNVQYLSETIDDFRNFISGNRRKMAFKLSSNIKNSLKLLENIITVNQISIVLNLDDEIRVNGYENELTQCLLNILNNAKDFLVEEKLDEKFIFIKTYEDEGSAIIEIQDNAGGIPSEIISRIFEPYFTTKHKDRGTGLGLNMTYKLIVDGMKGTIEVSNINYEYNGKIQIGALFKISISLN